MSNLTSLSGGRTNSWADTAAAQVGQAYAQKTADMVPELAQQAYNKLLQRYGIEAQESDRAYGRWQDAYGRARDVADIYGQRELTERELLRQIPMDKRAYRDSDFGYDEKQFLFGLDKAYLPQERQLNLSLLQEAVDSGKINLDALPEKIKLELEKRKQELEYYPKIVEAQLYQAYRPNQGARGGGSSSAPKTNTQTTQSEIAGMSKTALKEWVKREFTGKDGKVNKMEVLDRLPAYSAEEKDKIMSAAGITKADIDSWKGYKEQKREEFDARVWRNFIDGIRVSPFDIPL